MKLRLIGKRNNLGVGIHFTGFADAVKRIHGIQDLVEEVDFEDNDQIAQAIEQSQPDDVNISFISGNIHDLFRGHNIQWTVFESTRIPSGVMANLPPADSVWVPSAWGADILQAHGIDPGKISVIPEGVNTDYYHPFLRPVVTRPFRFLFVGKYEQRKSLCETITAFAHAFGNTPGVELLIKTHYTEYGRQDIEQQITDLKINNIGAYIGAVDNMANLYSQCDVLVLPSKGEGWGLPIIEAAAAGLPVITTYYSGHTEYLQYITNSIIPVDYDMVPVNCEVYKSFYPEADNDWGTWAQPRVDHLAECMVLSKTHMDFLTKNALENSQVIRTRFNWSNSANIALKTLQNQGLLNG
jgi:glycosyltransferase involved in cell wall biosynthesis